MAGKNVTQAGDQLHSLSLERLYLGLTQPKGNLIDLLQQLRSLKTIDAAAYRKAKTQLPYIVCGNFNPAQRRKENFAFTEHFIIDIDHLVNIDSSPDEIKKLLKPDERVAMLFTSPGGDGVKLVFNLQTRIHDAGYYSAFYKIFAASFAVQYRLEGAVDLVTNDVSRCCFMSYDPQAVYNEKALPVDAADYLDEGSLEGLFEASKIVKMAEQTKKELNGDDLLASLEKQNLPDDVLMKIRQKLNPALAARQPKTKEYYQPVELEQTMPQLKESLLQMGISLTETHPIQYGKKLKLSAGAYWAEINLFHGKHGFKAVQTTKTGSNKSLAAMALQAIQLYFDTREEAVILSLQTGKQL